MDPKPSLTPLAELLSSLRPSLHAGACVFCFAPDETALADLESIATFREAEGLTLVLEESVASRHGLVPRFRVAWITLGVNSDCADVGLTAAVSTALARAGIACNVIAAVNHDHLFVPLERAEEALRVLEALGSGR